jgi:DNA-binding MarR family transcriptional regulator
MRLYREVPMAGDARPEPQDCNCLAVRQAARHVTQFYDQCLAPAGLRTTQFSILAKLKRLGPMTINALAAELVMDRTTLGRNILPLERDGLIAIEQSAADRRTKELHVTDAGGERLRRAVKLWASAQTGFEAAFGAKHSAELRALLRAVVATDLGQSQGEQAG